MRKFLVGLILGVALASGTVYAATGTFLRAYGVDCEAWSPDRTIYCSKTSTKGLGVAITSHDVRIYNIRTNLPIWSALQSDRRAR
jgi:hypothetical protein